VISSVIVLQVNVDGILALESEGDPQIPRHGHSIAFPTFTFELVEFVAGHVHVIRPAARVQLVKHSFDSGGMLERYAAVVATREKLVQSLVSYGSDHVIRLVSL
jgi:hypothetical protein